MPTIAVVTDSCASIPEDLIKELNIHLVAYYIHRGQEVLRDLVTIQRPEFLTWLATAKTLPTTASPGPGDYLSVYESLLQDGVREIISLHMTSKGSGAYQAAKAAQSIAQESLPGLHIEVIDTLNVSLCQGWMVIEAARSALVGKSMSEICAQIKKMIPITHMLQTADTLKYLYMGGRIGQAQRLMGIYSNIKPLIGMQDGEIVPLGMTYSTRRIYQMMIDIIERVVGKKGRIKVAFVHAGAPEEIKKLKELVESRMTCVESLVAELSPALAVHSGPGTTGLCYYPMIE